MTTEILNSTDVKVGLTENKINYLWLNGERIIGIEGLQIFENCGQLEQPPAIKKEQIDVLNSIINATLEKFAEEGICNDWASLIKSAKNYLSATGYCVNYMDKVTVDLRKPVEVDLASLVAEKSVIVNRSLTAADLWKIYQDKKIRQQRRFL
ncbi:MAG: hypothetical protein WBP16_13750 [Ferruginibacter sp.]